MRQQRSEFYFMASVLMAGLAGVFGSFNPALAEGESVAVASNDVQLDDIVVTAQRRSEVARDVPISITALSGDQLANAGTETTRDLTALTPGLLVDRVGAYTQPSIRGVTTQLSLAGNESNVAIYVDGIYQPSQAANTFDLPDIDRIEVLKGPQGTLFGRNATGGAIRIVTLDPTYTFTGRVSASYGNFNEAIFNGFVSAPIVDNKLAVSLAGYYRSSDGYNHNLLANGADIGSDESKLVRGKILFDVTDDLRFVVTGFWSGKRDGGATLGIPLAGNTLDATVPGAVIPNRPYNVAANGSGLQVKSSGVDLKGELKLGSATLTSLTGLTNYKADLFLDNDYGYTSDQPGSNYIAHQPDRALSEELTLASNNHGPFNYTIGYYYYDAFGSYQPIEVQSGFPPYPYDVDVYGKQYSKANAVFGEIFYDVTSRLSLIGGLRYSRETRTFYGETLGHGAPQPDPPLIAARTDGGTTPRFSARYRLTDDTNVYFTYSEGFKSGQFNTTVPSATAPSVGPEKIKAVEVGLKSKASRELEFNAAMFYYKYTDMQVNAFQTVNGIASSVFQNAAAARIYGLDFEATYRPLTHFTLSSGLSILNAKFSDFPDAQVVVPTGTGGNMSVAIPNAKGNHLVRAPDWTLNLTANYSMAFAGGQLDYYLIAYHSDKFYFEVGNRLDQPEYTTLDARISWAPDNTGLKFGVYGKNLTNKAIIQGMFPTELADGASYAPPRTYGVDISYRF
ncbi:MAG TPA: TonB-dependent receptor [Steroidobacteraceae bacterium]